MRRINTIIEQVRYLSILTMMFFPVFGCSHLDGSFRTRSAFEEAGGYFNQGNYNASLRKYQQILEQYPANGDRALFEMGIIYGHPGNEEKDYQKALECFQKVIGNYPDSGYRHDSEMMVFYISNVTAKDRLIASHQKEIESLRQEAKGKESEIVSLRQEIQSNRIEITSLQQEIAALRTVQRGPADRILIEKKARRLTLIAKGEVLKTYKIALGGNPVGPKEKQGDNKTPEGSYTIDSRNRSSQYHLSLHISYPNDKDRKRAKQLGISPGGDIMIHGMKNGFSWFGEYHTEIDWTKGCIAVTDEEIEEIDKLAPNGTVVEIRP